MKTTRNTTSERAKKWRFNPLTNLQTSTLVRQLDAFEAGNLREAALIWEALEQRDDLLRGVISKRKKSVARHGWTVLPVGNLTGAEKARAMEHARALEHFYSHLECEHAVDRAERGGFKLLARQMMDAVGKRFAVHEIIWREAEGKEGNAPGANGDMGDLGSAGVVSGANRGFGRFVEAKFRFVPLAFFENTTGRLRFLEQDFAMEGRELEPGAWMTTVGDGLMVASSIAWMVKNQSLNDWLTFSSRHGKPALRGISGSARGSAEWNALEEAIGALMEGSAIVHPTADEVEVLDLKGGGTIPFPQLVERIDRMLAALWRGADLSTISRDRGYGASLQEKETCALEEDDAEMLTETLNRYVDEWVVRHVFGPDEKPLARVKVLVTPRECTSGDLQIDEFLIRHGAPLSIAEALNRYGRALPKSGEPIFMRGISKASLPESSQNLGMAEEMENQGYGCGPTVSFRGCSPSVPCRGRGDESLTLDRKLHGESSDHVPSAEGLVTSTSTNESLAEVIQRFEHSPTNSRCCRRIGCSFRRTGIFRTRGGFSGWIAVRQSGWSRSSIRFAGGWGGFSAGFRFMLGIRICLAHRK